MNVIHNILTGLFVLVSFGLCIFVHELGHFLAAKWRKLYIVAFSIGFKKVWSFRRGGVEYRIGMLPFGGYVELPQLEPGSESIMTSEGTPLPVAKPIDRIITAFAGPLFNIFFGIIIGTFLWIHGIPQDTPKMRSFEVASVDEESPEYKAGLRKGDIVYEINGKTFHKNWSGVVEDIIFTVGDVTLSVKRDGSDVPVKYRPIENSKLGKVEKIAYPFFKPKVPLIINKFKKDSPAEKAGLLKNDVLVEINGEQLNDQQDYIRKIDASGGKPLRLKVVREGRTLEFDNIVPVEESEGESAYKIGVAFNAKPSRELSIFQKILSKFGFVEKPTYILNVDTVIEDSPALAAGLQARDQIVAINGKPLENEDALRQTVSAGASAPILLGVAREGKQFEVNIVPELSRYWTIGAGFVFYYHPNPLEQFTETMVKTWKSLRSVASYVTAGKSTLKPQHFSGPVGIVHGMWVITDRGGIVISLYFTVLITYSLAVFNLLPIPVLDGGHIVMAVYEMVFRRKIPERLLKPILYVFVSLLIMMMLFVTFHDLRRLLFSFIK